MRGQTTNDRAQQVSHGTRDTGLLTILQRGNSDPFNVFAVSIDAKANEMMTFLRNIIQPALEGGAGRADWYTYDWETSVSFLGDKLTALAQFTLIAVAMHSKDSRRISVDGIQALSLQSQSIALLRARVTESRITEYNTYHGVFLLLLAEVFSRNFPAALVHTSLLAGLLQSGQIQENFHFVWWTLACDYQRAAMSRTRLCFDIQGWVPEFFEPFWHKAMIHLQSQTTEITTGLNHTIDDEDLRSICVDIRQAHLALSVEKTWENLNDEKLRYCRAFWTWILARLHHRYIDAAEILETIQPLACDPRITHVRVQAFFSLAAHCYTRICVDVDAIKRGQICVFNANSDLLLKLRDLLLEYVCTAEPADILKYSKIHLWALYVGSHAEQSARIELGNSSAVDGWFNTRLAERASRMGLMCWQDVREVLQGVHHSDSLRPHGSQWFWKITNVNSIFLKPETDALPNVQEHLSLESQACKARQSQTTDLVYQE